MSTGVEPGSGDNTVTGMSAGADLAPGTVIADRFRIVGLLGIGGMGVVYRAVDTALEVPVALKLLRVELAHRPDAFERFRQELLLSRQVSSPHVVRIHDIAHHEGRWLISMDLIEGEPLDKRLDARGPLPVEEALDITRQVALGLAAAHARQVIHRDLKPSNILIDPDGRAYISDFGIARSLGTSGLTRTGSVIGTPDYLSPEQARAEPIDGRSDLYALGLLLYEMLSGRPPFSGGTASESLTQRLLGPPPSIRKLRPETPAWVDRLLDRLLRTQPAHRLQDADAVLQAIEQRSVPRDLRPGRLGWTLAASAVVLAGIGVYAWQQEPAGIAPTLPAPDRVVVLPVENASGDSGLAPALAAQAELLRLQLASAGTLVVEGERVGQALAQVALSDTRVGEVDSAALLRVLPATTLLRPRLQSVTGGYRFSATVHRPGVPDRRFTSAPAPTLLAAASAFTPLLLAEFPPAPVGGASAPIAPPLLPTHQQTLATYGQALLTRRTGRLELALSHLAATTSREPGFAAAWLAQAQTALDAGRDNDALDAATRGAQSAHSDWLRATFTRLQALASGDSAQALVAQQAHVQAQPDDLDALLALAQLQGQAGDGEAAIASLRKLLERDAQDPRAWFLLGKHSIIAGDIRPAVDEYLTRALILYKRGRDLRGEAETANALGVGYSRLGQTGDALEQYEKAVTLRRQLGDRRGVASTLRNLAQLSTLQGRFDAAQAQLLEARALFEALGDEAGQTAVDSGLALLAEERGDFAGALVAFRRVLRDREQAGDQAGVAQSLNDIGFAQYQLGDYDSAQVFWRQALSAFEKLQDTGGVLRAQQNLGALEIARGRWAEARRLLAEALAVAEKRQMVEEAAVSRYYLAELELLEGRIGPALEQVGRAQTLFAQREDQRGLIDSGLLRGRILLAAGATTEAAAVHAKLAPLLAEASDEQKAWSGLLAASMAERRGDGTAAAAAWRQAQAAATASGVRALQLRVAIHGDPANAAALGTEIASLGNLPLRLDWLETTLRTRLATHDAAGAARIYSDALAALADRADVLAAAALHSLGAEALAASDDSAGAARAEDRARQAWQRLRSQAPERLRAGLETEAEAPGVQVVEHVP